MAKRKKFSAKKIFFFKKIVNTIKFLLIYRSIDWLIDYLHQSIIRIYINTFFSQFSTVSIWFLIGVGETRFFLGMAERDKEFFPQHAE